MTETSQQDAFVVEGMPDMDTSGRATSFFEFWPAWVMYLPVVLQWAWLSLRYRSLSLPLIANPAVPLSGMVGVPKTAVFDRAGSLARNWILPWLEYQVTGDSAAAQMPRLEQLMTEANLALPVVAKPNLGCRGVGVKLLQSEADVLDYVGTFPAAASIQFQQLADWEPEAGVFYVRHPDLEAGQITSLTLKYMPYVVGDGEATLAELIARDPRAGQLQHLYRDRHANSWHRVIDAGQPFRLVFAASHSRGAIFRDGNDYITDKLTKALDTIFNDIPGFYYGRLDIKFRSLDSLMNGEEFVIIEINGASSEAIHIWDRDTGFGEAVKTLLQQYQTLFTLGHANRQLGYKPPGLRALWDAWRHESRLVKQYPNND
jgi:hypothetical protein